MDKSTVQQTQYVGRYAFQAQSATISTETHCVVTKSKTHLGLHPSAEVTGRRKGVSHGALKFKWSIQGLNKSKDQLPDIFIVSYLATSKHTVFLVMSNKCQYLEENQRFINIEDLLKTSIITKSTFFNIQNICRQLFLDQFEIFTQKLPINHMLSSKSFVLFFLRGWGGVHLTFVFVVKSKQWPSDVKKRANQLVSGIILARNKMSLATSENRNKDREIMKEIHFSLNSTRTWDASWGREGGITEFLWLKHSL